MRAQRPQSATDGWIVVTGFAAFVAALFIVRHSFLLDPVTGAVIVVLMTTATNFFFDIAYLKVHKRESTGLDWTKKSTSFA